MRQRHLPRRALARAPRARARAHRSSSATGSPQEGYRGFFEVDYLADLDTGELYLGEINPRISGVTLDDAT